jgi:iduronate 2-sulfatase
LLENPRGDAKDVVFHVYPRKALLGRAVHTSRYRLVEWKEPGADANAAALELCDYEHRSERDEESRRQTTGVAAELRAILAEQPEAKPPLKTASRKRARQKNSSTLAE